MKKLTFTFIPALDTNVADLEDVPELGLGGRWCSPDLGDGPLVDDLDLFTREPELPRVPR